MDNRRFVPTDIGKIVNRFLTLYFHRWVEYGFTAALEDELDAVSRGEEEWTIPLQKFWKPFIQQVEKTEKNVSREQVAMAREIGTDPASGKPVTVRMGRFGPFVQIGTKDDEEKPRFAGLRPGQKMDNITLDDALYLFILPRTLGKTADDETVVTNVGRFGPYVKYGSKYVSLKEDDPYTVSLERALELIKLKQEADAARLINSFPEAGITVLNGRYGPYVTDGKKNAKIPKDRDPKSLTLEECKVMIELAPERGTPFGRRGKRGKQAAATPAGDGKAAVVAAKAVKGARKPTADAQALSGKKAVAPARKKAVVAATPAIDGKPSRVRPAQTSRAHSAPPTAAAAKSTSAARIQRKAHKPPAKKAARSKSAARKQRAAAPASNGRSQRAK
jgi:DNA topoisomerase-1